MSEDEYKPDNDLKINKENIGFAKGHNRLMNWAKTDYIMCLNQDMIIEPNFFDNYNFNNSCNC